MHPNDQTTRDARCRAFGSKRECVYVSMLRSWAERGGRFSTFKTSPAGRSASRCPIIGPFLPLSPRGGRPARGVTTLPGATALALAS